MDTPDTVEEDAAAPDAAPTAPAPSEQPLSLAAPQRAATCTESYLRTLACEHTLFTLLCQPRPPPGGRHTVDLEQLVQCFWSALLTTLAGVAALAPEGTDDASVDDAVVGSSALSADIVLRSSFAGASAGAGVGLLGCRLAFVWGGAAGRTRRLAAARKGGKGGSVSASASELGAPACCFGLCPCDLNSPQLWRRASRVAVGWSCALTVYVGACVACARLMASMTAAEVSALLHTWMLAQLLSWMLLEPSGLLLLALARQALGTDPWRARGGRATVTPTVGVRSRVQPPSADPVRWTDRSWRRKFKYAVHPSD